jgi:dTDP-4-amino-4,6-dideoxygalactose transaminase
VKLKCLDRWNAARRYHAATYNRLLAGSPVRLPVATTDAEHVYHLYVVQVEDRGRIQAALTAQGIHTGIHYPVPVHLQKACANLGYRQGDFPVTEAAAQLILSLPMFPELAGHQIKHVAHVLRQASR